MNKIVKSTLILTTSFLFIGCVAKPTPKPTPKPPMNQTHTNIRVPDEYGYPPRNYKQTIRKYFANKIKRPQMASFTFSKPVRAYKRIGLAYGGAISWKGWLVDVTIATKSRSGRLQSPKPYMVLFNNSVIVEDILGKNHELITRVGN